MQLNSLESLCHPSEDVLYIYYISLKASYKLAAWSSVLHIFSIHWILFHHLSCTSPACSSVDRILPSLIEIQCQQMSIHISPYKLYHNKTTSRSFWHATLFVFFERKFNELGNHVQGWHSSSGCLGIDLINFSRATMQTPIMLHAKFASWELIVGLFLHNTFSLVLTSYDHARHSPAWCHNDPCQKWDQGIEFSPPDCPNVACNQHACFCSSDT